MPGGLVLLDGSKRPVAWLQTSNLPKHIQRKSLFFFFFLVFRIKDNDEFIEFGTSITRWSSLCPIWAFLLAVEVSLM